MKAPVIRRLLKDKAFFLAEYPNAVVIAAFNYFITAYRSKVGKADYIDQMLGPISKQPATEAHYFDVEGTRQMYLIMPGETVFDLLKRTEPLPFIVRWQRQERYL